jgi:hypothetical protein
MLLEGLSQLKKKNAVISSGIDPAIFRLVWKYSLIVKKKSKAIPVTGRGGL